MAEALYSEDFQLSVADLSLTGAACSLVGRGGSLAICRAAARDQKTGALHFERTELRAEDVVLTELLSCRGPAAWLSVSDEAPADRMPLCQLAKDCALLGQALTLSGGLVDLVLVPRPCAAPEDELCVPFVLFLTKLNGVSLLARLLKRRSVGVQLDIDATLLESEHLQQQPLSWNYREWRQIELTALPSGAAVSGYAARLPAEPHCAQEVHAATWTRGGFHHSYNVRVRPGWADFKACLIQEAAAGRVDTYICSSGRPLYIQLVWRGVLDADSTLVPHDQLLARVNSARPEGVTHVPAKSPGIGFGLACPTAPEFKLRLGPLFVLDDLPEAWSEHHRDSVLQCEAYRPAAHLPLQHDDGIVLRSAGATLKRFWAHCFGDGSGSGGAVAGVQAAARASLAALQSAPLTSVRELNRLIAEAEEKGEALWGTISLAGFLAAEAAAAAAAAAAAPALDKENTTANLVPSSPRKPSPAKQGDKAPGSTADAAAAPAHPLWAGGAADAVLRPSSRQGPLLGTPVLGSFEEVDLVLPAPDCDLLASQPSGSSAAAVAAAQHAAAAADDSTRPAAAVDQHVTVQVLDGQDGVAQVLLLMATDEAAEEEGEAAAPVVLAGRRARGESTEEELITEAAEADAALEGMAEGGSGHKREGVPLEAAGEVQPLNKRRSSG